MAAAAAAQRAAQMNQLLLVSNAHQRHLQFMQPLDRGFIVRNDDGTEMVVQAEIHDNELVVHFSINRQQAPTTGSFRVANIGHPAFLTELRNTIMRVSVSLSIYSYNTNKDRILWFTWRTITLYELQFLDLTILLAQSPLLQE
jgi:hypothetical protein